MTAKLSNVSPDTVMVDFEGVRIQLNRTKIKKLKKLLSDAERQLDDQAHARFLERNLKLPFEDAVLVD